MTKTGNQNRLKKKKALVEQQQGGTAASAPPRGRREGGGGSEPLPAALPVLPRGCGLHSAPCQAQRPPDNRTPPARPLSAGAGSQRQSGAGAAVAGPPPPSALSSPKEPLSAAPTFLPPLPPTHPPRARHGARAQGSLNFESAPTPQGGKGTRAGLARRHFLLRAERLRAGPSALPARPPRRTLPSASDTLTSPHPTAPPARRLTPQPPASFPHLAGAPITRPSARTAPAWPRGLTMVARPGCGVRWELTAARCAPATCPLDGSPHTEPCPAASRAS